MKRVILQVVVGNDGCRCVPSNSIAYANSANISDFWKSEKLQESMFNWHHAVLSVEHVVVNGFTMGWESIHDEDFTRHFQNIGIESMLLGHCSWYGTDTMISSREAKFNGFDFWRLILHQSSNNMCGAHLLHEKEYRILQVTLHSLLSHQSVWCCLRDS